MSKPNSTSTQEHTGRPPAAHAPHLAHHFDNPRQQFEAAVQGMWLFLATEILLFGGLFCAYAVYRANHPDIFEYAHEYLSKALGATNTVILLCSSFTMATAVWAAQRSRKRLTVWMLALTLLGGLGFLSIKYVEYQHKWKEGLLWGTHFHPLHTAPSFTEHARNEHHLKPPASAPATAPAQALGEDQVSPTFTPPETATGGLLPAGRDARQLAPERKVRNVQTFFGIYFAMTGLHGIHVIAGLVIIAWLLRRAVRGDFVGGYYTPVDLGGLYWHLVDLIWIYLFPLLYLIH